MLLAQIDQDQVHVSSISSSICHDKLFYLDESSGPKYREDNSLQNLK